MAGIPSSKQSITGGTGPALVPQGHHAGKPPISLARPVTLIGARHNAHLHLLSRSVSKAHALIINYDSRLYIRDLASRTHTYVNGKRVIESNLNPGDTIQIGSFVFKINGKAKKHDGTGPTAPSMSLDIKGAEMPLPIEQRVILIGRRETCDISLLEETASTAHAVIFEMGGKRHVRDLGSRTGTYVNGKKVRQQVLNEGDVVLVGETEMRYVRPIVEGELALEEGMPSDAIDELEHLVGTAPLVGDALDEVVREAAEERHVHETRSDSEPAPIPVEPAADADEERDIEIEVAGTEREEAKAAPEPEISATPEVEVPQAEAPRSQFDDEADAIPLEGEDASGATGEEGGIDLDADPDVNRTGPADTRVLPAFPEPPPKPPVISEQVVDAIDLEQDEDASQQLVSADLVNEKLSSSATHTDLSLAAEQAKSDTQSIPSPEEQQEWPAEVAAEAPADEPAGEDDSLKEVEAVWGADPAPETQIDVTSSEREEPVEPLDLAPPADEQPEAPKAESTPVEPLDLGDEPVAESPATKRRGGRKKGEPKSGGSSKVKVTRKVASKTTGRRGRQKAGAVEVVDKTDPTPDSAFALNEAMGAESSDAETLPPAETKEPELTDTGLGMIVSEFSAGSKEPIVTEQEDVVPEIDAAVVEPSAEIEFSPPPAEEEPEIAPIDEQAAEIETLVFDETPAEPAPVADASVVEPQAVAPIVEEADISADAPKFDADIEPELSEPVLSEPEAEAPAEVEPPVEAETPAEAEIDAEIPAEPVAEAEEEPAPAPIAPPAQVDAAYFAPESGLEPVHAPGVDPVDEAPEPESAEAGDAGQDLTLDTDAPLPIEGLPDDFTHLAGDEGDQERTVASSERDDVTLESAGTVEYDRNGNVAEPIKVEEPEGFEEILPEDEAAEEVAEAEGPVDTGEAPAAPEAPPAPSRPASKKADASDDLLGDEETGGFGFGSSAGYLGGMPLNLGTPPRKPSPTSAPEQPAAKVSASASPAAPGASPTSKSAPAMVMPPPPARKPPAPKASFSNNHFDALASGFGFGEGPDVEETIHGSGNAHAFDGLAMGALDEVDVFSQMPQPRADDPILGLSGVKTAGADGANPPDGEEAPQTVLPADEEGADVSVAPLTPQPAREGNRLPPPPVMQTGPARKKRRRFLGIPFLVALMLMSLAAAGGAVYSFVHQTGVVQGKLRFENYAQLTEYQRIELQKELVQLLAQENLRKTAAQLMTVYPDAPQTPGMLADAESFTRNRRDAQWSDNGQWTLPFESRNVAEDRYRVHALMVAIEKSDVMHRRVDAFNNHKQDLAMAENAMADAQRVVEQLQRDIAELEQRLGGRTSMEQLVGLEAEVVNLEKAWKAAKNRRADLETELEKLKAEAAQIANSNGDASGSGAEFENDPDLKKMEQSLADHNRLLAKARDAANAAAENARRALDEATAAFEKQIAELQEQMGGDPKLIAYVEAVKRLKDDVHQLTSELIQAQKESADAIMGLKRLIDEKVEARRQLAWQQDPQLRELRDQLELKTRQLNAARAGGEELAAEAETIAKDIESLQTQIKNRQDAVGADPLYTETIQELQEIIEANQRRLAESRRRADELLARATQRFEETAPSVENLPAEQKAMAEALRNRIDEMDRARTAYAEAMAAKANDADANLKMLEEEISKLRARIASRRQQLADEQRQRMSEQRQMERAKAIEAKEGEIAAAKQAEVDADQAYELKHKELREMKAAVTRYGEYTAALEQKHVALKQSQEKVAALKATVIAYPAPVTKENAVETQELSDQRPLYAGIAGGGVLLVFSVLIVLAARGESTPEHDPFAYDEGAAVDQAFAEDVPHPKRSSSEAAVA